MSTEPDSNSGASANSGVVSGTAKIKSLLKQVAETDQLTDRTAGIGPGRGITPPYDPSDLASLLELNGVHAASVAKKARREVGFGFEIEPIETVDEEDASEEERQRAEEFWLGPATKWKLGPTGTPFATPEEVVEKARQDWHAVGWSALETLYAGADTEPQGLAYIPAQMIRQRKGEHGFVYKRDGQVVYLAEAGDRHTRHDEDTERYVDKKTGDVTEDEPPSNPANEILWIPNPHPNARNGYGIPDWISELQTIIADREARRFNRKRLENDLMMDYIIKVEGGKLTEETRDDMREWLSEMRESDEPELLYLEAEELADSSRVGETGSGATISVEPAAHFNDEDSSFQGFRDNNKRDIAMAHEIPLPVLGEHDATNTNTEEAIREFTDEVIKPNQRRFEERLYRSIHQQILDITDWRVSFITKGAQNPQREANVLATKLGAAKETLEVNEVREMLGVEPQPELDGILVGEAFDPRVGELLIDALQEEGTPSNTEADAGGIEK